MSLTTFDRLATPAVMAAIGALFVLESLWPLRSRVEHRLTRTARNVAFGVIGGLVVRLLVVSIVVRVAGFGHAHQLGLLALLPVRVPAPALALIAFVLLDASMYLWHRLNHRVPRLWRFHLVHHVDLDLDVSTALRFHPGELLLSVPFRALQVLVLGPSVPVALGYELAMQLATAFHHANWRLPLRVERALNLFVVTPRMHQIHHSVIPHETNSNWSVIFSIWDRLARSYRCDLTAAQLTIGVPEYRLPEQVTLSKMFRAPFLPTEPRL